eukprot:IDg19722t1
MYKNSRILGKLWMWDMRYAAVIVAELYRPAASCREPGVSLAIKNFQVLRRARIQI